VSEARVTNEVRETARFQPVGEQYLIRPIEVGERMIGSIIAPDRANTMPKKGLVVARGSRLTLDGTRIPLEVDPGIVIFYRDGGTIEVESDDGGRLLLVHDNLVVGKEISE